MTIDSSHFGSALYDDSTQSLLSLTSAEIHLWLAHYNEFDHRHLQSAYMAVLTSAEIAQLRRFHFAKDQQRFLITRALVRTVLSRYIRIHPRDWIFSNNSYGRPDIANSEGKTQCLSFNISHTQGLIVLAVTKKRSIGVDVENYRARKASIDIADSYFSRAETSALLALQPDQQQYAFFEYWTFKEAYIKARGMGLSLPLDKFSFHYPNEQKVEISIHPELADDCGRWLFWQLEPSADHLVAVCAEKDESRFPILVVRQTIPMVSEQILSPTFRRTS